MRKSRQKILIPCFALGRAQEVLLILRAAIQNGDKVKVDFDTGVITDETTGETFQAQPFPPFIQNIIQAGGLMNSIAE